MLNSITINNFKAIQHPDGLILNNLAKVNYLVGKNGCGKSSVLECIVRVKVKIKLNRFLNTLELVIPKNTVLFIVGKKIVGNTQLSGIRHFLFHNTFILRTMIYIFPGLITCLFLFLIFKYDLVFVFIVFHIFFYNVFYDIKNFFNPFIIELVTITDIDKEVKQVINATETHILENIMKSINLEFENIEKNEITINSKTHTKEDKSSGERRILNLLISISQSSIPIILIEEPECFLHPEFQKKVPKLLSKLSVIYNKQIILTTHSPYIITSAIDLVQEDFGEFKCLPENEGKTAKELKNLFNPSQKVYKIEDGTCKNPEGSWGENAIFESSQLLGAGLNIRMPDKPVQNQSYIVYCEDESADNYNEIFRNKNCLFVACGSCTDVVKQFTYSKEFYKYQKGQIQIVGLVDNDPENPKTTDWQNIGIKVLTRREIENYLYDEVVIKSFDSSFDYTKASIINNVVDEMKGNKILSQKFRSKQLELSKIIREMGNEDQSCNNVYWQLHNLIFN